jgi:hypothetical protein
MISLLHIAVASDESFTCSWFLPMHLIPNLCEQIFFVRSRNAFFVIFFAGWMHPSVPFYTHSGIRKTVVVGRRGTFYVSQGKIW